MKAARTIVPSTV